MHYANFALAVVNTTSMGFGSL